MSGNERLTAPEVAVIKDAVGWLEYLVEVSNTNKRQDRSIRRCAENLKKFAGINVSQPGAEK